MTIAPAANGGNGGAGGGGRVKIFYDDCAWNNFLGIVRADSGGLVATNGSIFWQTKPTTFTVGNISPLQDPENICVISGVAQTTTALPAATNFTPNYQWQMQVDCAGAWVDVIGANGLSFTPSGLTDTACFRLLVTSGNCSGIYADTLQINTIPAPIYNLSTNSLSFCAGNTANLSITSLLPIGANIQWYHNGNVVSAANGGNTNPLNISISGTYFALVSSAGTCTGTTDTANVSINPLPIANMTVSNTNFCVGDSVIIVATGGGNYQWQAPIISTNDTVFVSQNGIFCVNVINTTTNCSTTVCSPQISQAINANSDIQTTDSTNICAGDTVHFTTTASLTNQWLLNGNPIVGATGQNFSATQAGVYSVIAIFSQNCRDTSSSINVNMQAQGNANILPLSALNVCENDSILLTASGGNNYIWLTPLGNISADTLILNSTTAGNYQVIGFNIGNTCPDTSASVAISFFPSPTPSITIANGTNPFCMGDSLQLTCNGYTNYQWLKDNLVLAGETNNNITIYNSGIYSVIVTDANGCVGTSSAFSVQTATLNPPIIVGDTLICAGESSNLQATGNFSTYQWLLNGVNVGNGANFQASQAGTYVVNVTFGTCASNSSPFTLNIAPKPTVNISPNDTIYACNLSNPVSFVASGANTYQWYNQSGTVSGQNNSEIFVYVFSTYYVIGTNAQGCKDTSESVALIQSNPIAPSINVMGSTQICEGDSVKLQTNASNVIAWLLNGELIPNSAGKTTLYAHQTGTYSLITADFCGNDTSSVFINISYISINAAFSYSPTEIYALSPIQFINESNSTGNPTWLWNFGDGNFSNAKNSRHIYTKPDSFWVSLTVTLPSGCKDSISHTIYVYTMGSLFLPNIFTPNKDGENDIWKAQGIDVLHFELTLYDRWGKIVSTFSQLNDFWDGTNNGKPAPEGVYTYQYKAYFRDGRSISKGGSLTLLR